MPMNPLFWLLITPIICALILYVVGRTIPPDDESSPNKAAWLSLFSILLTVVPFVLTAKKFTEEGPVSLTAGMITLTFDGISLLMTSVLLVLSAMVVLFSAQYMVAEDHEEKFYGQIMILMSSIMGLTTATDIFNLYVWFELMAVSTYTLVSFYRNRTESLESGIKYLVQSAAVSVLVILGTSILFGLTGEVKISAIRESILTSSPAVIAATACLLIGYGVKCAIVPMHFWLPDAHSQAPAGISALLSGIVIETGLIALLRALSAVSHAHLPLGTIFLVIGCINMFIGTFSALRQKEIKRMLAFSSVSQMGYILLGIGFAISFPASAQNAEGIFTHIFNHALMKGLAFLSAGALVYCIKVSKGNHEPLLLDDLNGVSAKYPLYSLAFTISMLALGGLPLFAGFISKWQILASGIAAQKSWVAFLIALAGINSVLSLGHYAPPINRIYRHVSNNNEVAISPKFQQAMIIPIIILTAAVILLGFFPGITAGITKVASETLYTMFY